MPKDNLLFIALMITALSLISLIMAGNITARVDRPDLPAVTDSRAAARTATLHAQWHAQGLVPHPGQYWKKIDE